MITSNASVQRKKAEVANNINSDSDVDSFLPPYLHPITEDIVLLDNNKLMSTIVIKGSPFDLESPKQVQTSFEMYKEQLVNIGKGNISKLAVWCHTIKKRIKLKTDYKFKSKFMQRYSDRYIWKMNAGNFFEVSYYITLVYKFSDLEKGIEELNNIISSSMSFLKKFNSSVLKIEINNNGTRCRNKEFLYYLYNHSEVEFKTLSKDCIVDSISESDIHFGYDFTEIRNKNSLKKEYMICYNMKDYPARTKNGMWDKAILEYPCEFILCQSFIYFSTSKSLKVMDDQINKMVSTDDNAIHQLAELEVGKGFVASQETFLGSLHGALIVYGDTQEEVLEHGTNLTGEFSSVNKYGVRFVKSTLDSLYTFFSIFPASSYRPLCYPHSSTNLACGFSLHNYSMGKDKGNPIGDGTAIMPLNTSTDGLYFLNTHYSNPNQNVTGQKIAGHALILGATGAGKTTLETTMMGFLTRFDPYIFGIDFNRSFELAFRAFEGNYFTIREGENTGINPFQLNIPEGQGKRRYLGFLYELVMACASENGSYIVSPEEENIIKLAVDSVMRLPIENRRFSLLMQSIPNGTSLKLRLSKWCHSENGRFAWALDSEVNLFDPSEFKKIAFDSTEILENPSPVTEPILATLFFFKNLMQKSGKLMLTLIEEFWVPCNYKLTQKMIKGALKAGRLKGEFVYLISQSPEDAIDCEIFAPIVQQTPTKILLPNPDAKYKGSYQLIGLNEYEFEKLVKLDKESRKFLIKQSASASICKMDLYGFDEFLPIISGGTDDIELVEKIRKELNTENPDIWIPEFYLRKGISIKEKQI